MRSLKVVIVDDEKNAVESILTIIEKFCVGVEVIGTAYSATDGVEIINKTNPDLAFIDIEMPDANGFDIVNCVNVKKTMIVFVTAFEQYAIKAFKVNVMGYLLKPVNIGEVQDIIEKAKRMIDERDSVSLINNKKHYLEKLCVPSHKGHLFIDPSNIIFVEADGRYSKIHVLNEEVIFVTKNLGEIEKLLNPDMFFRTHNSSIINLNYIHEFNTKDGCFLLMKGGEKVLLSRRKKDEFLRLFKK